MFKVNNKDTRTMTLMYIFENLFHTFSKVSIAEFEEVNVYWAIEVASCSKVFERIFTLKNFK